MAHTKAAFGAAMASLLLLPHLGGAAATPAQKCAAAKNLAAATKTTAEARCYRRSLLTGLAVNPKCLSNAEQKFTNAIARAEAKGTCIRTGDAADIEAAVDSCVSSLDALTLATDCTPVSSCLAGHACISLADNAAQNTFGLRMSQLILNKPTVLAGGILGTTIANALEISENACNLFGSGTFNWLLDLDKAAQTLETGGAAPVSNPSLGYAFQSGTVFGSSVAPVTTPLSLAGNGAFSTTAADVSLPVYLDQSGVSGFILPLSALSFSGQLSADQNCVGSYNSSGLVPPACAQDASHPTFLNGGTTHASITLENADAVIVSVFSESLCVLLSGDAAQYGDGGNPTRCKRSGGTILFAGDYCSSTGTPGGCADSMEFSGSFAASAVTIH